MVQEAEKFAKEDKEKREAIDTKNQAESVVYQTEKQLKELGDKLMGSSVATRTALKNLVYKVWQLFCFVV